jgi:hypothetical protein
LKLILSRKGFDSAAGGVASPILPDGRIISLPIPSHGDNFAFRDINVPDADMHQILSGISRQKYSIGDPVHLDPDLDRSMDNRLPGWRPALGQTSAAQTHLKGQGVGIGDVFLFFGWFRKVEPYQNSWRYVPHAPDLHVMFGWLEIGDVINVQQDRNAALAEYPWIADHPHVANADTYTNQNNTVYVAPEHSAINPDAPFGGGRFKHFSDALRLTSKGETRRSMWTLPGWFYPDNRPALSYHRPGGKKERWRKFENSALLNTVGRGQEFVIDGEHYPELEKWVSSIIRNHS